VGSPFPPAKESDGQSQQRTPDPVPLLPAEIFARWDDQEWNSVKDWFRIAETAVRKSHRAHGEIVLPPTRKYLLDPTHGPP
jgi:hypothetical protein